MTARRTTQQTRPVDGPPAGAWLFSLLYVHLGISPVVFSVLTIEPFDYPKSLLLQFAAFLAFGWIAADPARRKGEERPSLSRLARDPLGLGVVLFGCSVVLSTVFSISPRTSIEGETESFAGLPTLLAAVGLFFATRVACESWSAGRALLIAPVIGGTIAALYSLAQAAALDAFAWHRVAEFGGARPFGTLGNANTLSSFLVAIWPIEVCLAIHSARRSRRYTALAFGAAALIGTVAILRSASRAGWLGLVLGILGVLALLFAADAGRAARRVAGAALALAATVIAVAALSPSGRQALGWLSERAMSPTGLDSRSFLWSSALDLFKSHPLLGTGVDTFGLAFTPHRTPEFWALEWNTTFVRAHNEGLQLLATQGLLGAAAALLMILGLGHAARIAWQRRPGDDRLLLGSTLVGLICLAPQMSVGVLQTAPAVLLITLAALVSAASLEREASEERQPARTRRLSKVVAGLAPVWLILNSGAWTGDGLSGLITAAAFCLPLIVVISLDRESSVKPPSSPATRVPGPAVRRAPNPARPGVAALVGLGALVVGYPQAAGNVAAARGSRLTGSDPGAALRSFERAASLDPGHAAHWSRLALAQQAAAKGIQGEGGRTLRQRAAEALTRAARLQPLRAQYSMLRCRALTDQALASEAKPSDVFAACDLAIAQEPSNPYFYTAAVNAAVQLGDLRRARLLVSAGLERYPDLAPLQYQLGFIALQDAHLDEASQALEAAAAGNWHGANGREGAERALDEVRRRQGAAAGHSPR